MSAARELVDKKVLKGLFPLNNLSAVHLKEVTKKAVIQEVAAGQIIFQQGKRDSDTFYLLSGHIALIDGHQVVGNLSSGTAEAKRPIAPGQPRKVTARAKSKVTIMRIDTSLLDVLLEWDQSAQYEVTEIQSDANEDWMTKMLKSELFSHIPATNIQNMIMRMKEVRVKKGTTIINQHDPGDCYYIIKKGQCVVSRQTSKDSKPVLIAELRDGDSFGEEALLSESRRNATVTMITNGSLMRLAKEDFVELLQEVLVNKVSFRDACAMVEEGARWLDVQLPGESAKRTLPGSINIPLQGLRNSREKLDSNTSYIVFCADGSQSASAVFLLGQYGYDAVLLHGGLNAVPPQELQALAERAEQTAEVITLNTVVPEPAVPAAKIPDSKPVEKNRAKPRVPEKKDTADNRKEKKDKKEKAAKKKESAANKSAEVEIGRQAAAAQIEKLNKELRSARRSLTQKENQLAAVSEEKEKLSLQLNRLSDKLNSGDRAAQETVDELHEQLEEMQYEHELERKELEKENAKLRKSADKADALRSELKELKIELKESIAVRASVEKELEKLRSAKQNLEKNSESTVGKLGDELSKVKATLEAQQQENATLKNQLKELDQKRNSEVSEVSSKLELVTEELARSREEYQELQERLTDILVEKEALERDNLESRQLRTSLLEQQSSAAKEANATITRLNKEVESLREELDASRSMVEQISRAAAEKGSDAQNDKEKQEFLSTIQKQQERVQLLEKQNGELHELLTASEKNIEKLKEQKSKIEFDWQAAEKSRTGLLEQNENIKRKYEEQLKELESRLEAHEQDKAALQGKLQSALDEKTAALESVRSQLEQAQQERDSLSKELKESVSRLSGEEKQLKAENTRLQKALEKRDTRIKEVEDLLQAMELEKQSIEEAKLDLQKDKRESERDWEEKYEQKVSELRGIKYRNDQLETEINILKTDYEQSSKRVEELTKQCEEMQFELKQANERPYKGDAQDEEYQSLLRDMNSLEMVYKKETSSSREKIEQLEKTVGALEEEVKKYRELQTILEEKNQELEDEVAFYNEKQGRAEEYEKEIQRLKQTLADQAESGNMSAEQRDAYDTLKKEYRSVNKELEEVKKKYRDLERAKNQFERDAIRLQKTVKAEGSTAQEHAKKIKELSKVASRSEKELEKVKEELEQYRTKAREADSELRSAQKALKQSEKKLVQMSSELKIAEEATSQLADMKAKLADIKQETKDQLKHYQYEYENMVQKAREDNRKLRMEIERLHQQLQNQSMANAQQKPAAASMPAQQRPPQAPGANVMPLDLPPDRNAPLNINEIPAPNQPPMQQSGKFKVPGVAAKRSTTPADRIFSAAESGPGSAFQDSSIRHSRMRDSAFENSAFSARNVFGEDVDDEEDSFNIGRLVITLIVLAIAAAGAYWYFDVYPKIKREQQQAGKKKGSVKPAGSTDPFASRPRAVKLPAKKPKASADVAKARKPVTAKEKPKQKPKEEKAVKMVPGRTFRDALGDGTFGPAMVVVPKGSFKMGSGKGALDTNETPRHTVKLRRFSISKHEVTFEDYKKFARATGREMPDHKDWGMGRRPVINVSWKDAVAYTKWLSSKTGRVYRLPTEAEWEYAARAGTYTQYPWGNSVGKNRANCFDCASRWDSLQTAPVGSFKPNPLGLYDMNGNVMEWTQDCYHKSYRGAPRNGAAWISGGCSTRVVRGGSYKSTTDGIRSFAREHMPPDTKASQIGFRIVREM